MILKRFILLMTLLFALGASVGAYEVSDEQYRFSFDSDGVVLEWVYNNNPDSIKVPSAISYKERSYPVVSVNYRVFFASKRVILPSTIKRLDVAYINGYEPIASIEIDSLNKYLTIKDKNVYSKDLSKLILYTHRDEKKVSLNNPELKIIGEYAFSTTGVTDIVINSPVLVIEEGAFYFCDSLKQVSLPETVEVIGEKAFNWCKKLEKINFPRSLEQIQKSAFSECYSLNSPVILSSSVEEIGAKAFYNCRISTLTLPEDLERIESKAFTELRVDSLIIPNSVNYIGKEAFSYGQFSFVKLPEDLEYIDEGAFARCKNLTSIKFPTPLKYIGINAFGKCFNLKVVQFNEGLLKIEHLNEDKEIKDQVFNNCTALKEITFPSTLKSLPLSCIEGCKSLERINIPANIPQIDFKKIDCPSLKEINIQGESKRYRTQNGIVFTSNLDTVVFYPCDKKYKNKYLPKSVKCFGEYSFQYNRQLKKIIVPLDIALSEGVFYKCSNLEKVILSESNKVIPDQAFYMCENLAVVRATNSLNKINPFAFYMCTSLREFNLPNSVNYIGRNAFTHCKSLEEVIIPENIKTIEYRSFTGCENIKKIILPEGLLSIDGGGFASCSSVRTIVFPKSLKTLSSNSLAWMIGLESIIFNSESPPYMANLGREDELDCLNGVDLEKLKVIIPKGCYENYNLQYGKVFKNIIEK